MKNRRHQRVEMMREARLWVRQILVPVVAVAAVVFSNMKKGGK